MNAEAGQLAPEFRGRVAALFAVAFLGSTPIGAPIIGGISQIFGPRSGIIVGGVTALVAGGLALRSLNQRVADRAADRASDPPAATAPA